MQEPSNGSDYVLFEDSLPSFLSERNVCIPGETMIEQIVHAVVHCTHKQHDRKISLRKNREFAVAVGSLRLPNTDTDVLGGSKYKFALLIHDGALVTPTEEVRFHA